MELAVETVGVTCLESRKDEISGGDRTALLHHVVDKTRASKHGTALVHQSNFVPAGAPAGNKVHHDPIKDFVTQRLARAE
jgi:hypothetical protein